MKFTKNKNMSYFLTSDLLSGFAIGMSLMGSGWFVMDQTQSSLQVGYLSTLNVLSSFIVSLFAGILTDKYERKKLMQISYLLGAFLLSIIFIMFVFFDFHISFIYLCSIINGAIWSIYLSSSKSLLQEILPKQSITQGNSLIEISLQFGTLSAGLVSGIIFRFSGFMLILFFNIAAFLGCFLLLNQIKYQSTIIPATEKEPVLKSYLKGLVYLVSDKKIFLTGIVSIVPLTVTTFFNVVLPGYVYNALDSDSFTFGMGDMLYGIGALIAGLLVPFACKKLNKQMVIYISFYIASLAFIPLFFKESISIFFMCCFIFGISNVFIKIIANAQLMSVITPAFMGRSIGAVTGVSLLVQSFGSLAIGTVVDNYGNQYGFISIIVVLLLGLLIYFYANLCCERKVV